MLLRPPAFDFLLIVILQMRRAFKSLSQLLSDCQIYAQILVAASPNPTQDIAQLLNFVSLVFVLI